MFVKSDLGDISDYLKAAFTPGAMVATVSSNVFDIFKNLSGKSVVSAPAPVLQDFAVNIPMPSLNVASDATGLSIPSTAQSIATINTPWYQDRNKLMIIGGVAFTIAGLYVLRGKK